MPLVLVIIFVIFLAFIFKFVLIPNTKIKRAKKFISARESEITEHDSVIDEALGEKIPEIVQANAIVVTNAKYTPRAKQLAAKAGVKLMHHYELKKLAAMFA